MINIEVINTSHHPLPKYQTEGSAGLDLIAYIKEPILLKPMERAIIPTGLFIALPQGYEAQIRPRSGLAFKHGITVLNAPGTIDADYRGEIKVLLINLSDKQFTIHDGERIAQIVFSRHESILWQITEKLSATQRGDGGFGSTGTQT